MPDEDPFRPNSRADFWEKDWQDDWRERIEKWKRNPQLLLILAVIVTVGFGGAWFRSHHASAVAGMPSAAPTSRAATTASSSSTTNAANKVTVDVAGAVVHPGVTELHAGSRVIDAIEAVGGAIPEADLDRLNLAAKLVDGQRILVSRQGDPASAADSADTSGTTGTDQTAQSSGPVNLNTATSAQLDTLPGIGPSLAQAIITYREKNNGFHSVNDLRKVRGIGDSRFADLKDLVTV